MKTGHQMIRLRRRGPLVRVSSHNTPSGSTVNVAAALTPPTIATASPAGRATGGENLRGTHGRGEQDPRCQRAGPGLDRDRAQSGEHPGRQCEREAGGRHGEVGPDAERRWRLSGPRGSRHHDQRRAKPAAPPMRGRGQDMPSAEEGTHRPQVAIGLVLQLTEGALGVPQVQGRPRKPTGSRPGRTWCRRRGSPGTWTKARADQEQALTAARRVRVAPHVSASGVPPRGSTSPPHAAGGRAATTSSTAGCSAAAPRPPHLRSASGPRPARPGP